MTLSQDFSAQPANSHRKPLRTQDRLLLEQLSEGQIGYVPRQTLVTAAKRAGAEVHVDGRRRLLIVFGSHSVPACGFDVAINGGRGFERQLKALAQDLLKGAACSLR